MDLPAVTGVRPHDVYFSKPFADALSHLSIELVNLRLVWQF
jgi:hypothetical protein